MYFNPRPREEGDVIPRRFIFKQTYFNPRPREEGDIPYRSTKRVQNHFNPRPREEGDTMLNLKSVEVEFQSTPS